MIPSVEASPVAITAWQLLAGAFAMAVLLVPVVGVAASILVLADRPSATDFGGFALIFAAAVCALVARAKSSS